MTQEQKNQRRRGSPYHGLRSVVARQTGLSLATVTIPDSTEQAQEVRLNKPRVIKKTGEVVRGGSPTATITAIANNQYREREQCYVLPHQLGKRIIEQGRTAWR